MTDTRTKFRWAFWPAMLVLVTLVLLWSRPEIDQSHVALTLLLVVLGGSAGGGRSLGFSLALVSFIVIDYLFQPPYELLSVDKPLDWVVLVAFVTSAFVATELLERAREEAALAKQRADEIAALGEERLRLSAEAQHARALREENRAKDEVLAAVSHDLRTPLTTIKLLAQTSGANGDSNAQAIEEQTDLLSQMVTNVLDLSRIRSGSVSLDLELNTAEDLIGAAVASVAGILGDRRIEAAPDLGDPPLAGRFDFVQSLRIVGNLLDNAIRYTPPGGTVRIDSARESMWMIIRVCDQGPGIPTEARPHIFEPFYRASSDNAHGGHAGLGLSIAKRLAELQGGVLKYEPMPEGGSSFLLLLPAADSTTELSLEDSALSAACGD